jgi:hypothetical protein
MLCFARPERCESLRDARSIGKFRKDSSLSVANRFKGYRLSVA